MKKGFSLIEVMIAIVLLGVFTSFILVSNNALVNALNQGVRSAHAANEADSIRSAVKALADESHSIFITPLLGSGPGSNQIWVSVGGIGDNNVNVNRNVVNISSLTFEDIQAVDAFIFENRPSWNVDVHPMNRYYYNPVHIKQGFLVWFNTLSNNGNTYVRAVLEIRLLNNSSYGVGRVNANDAAGVFPRTNNTTDSVRVTLFAVPGHPTIASGDQLLMTRLNLLQNSLGELNNKTPNDNYFGFKGSKEVVTFNSSGQPVTTTETATFTQTLVPLASYVVDYKTVSDLPYKDGVVIDSPAEYAVYHSVRLLDDTPGAVRLKLPHPYDLDAVRVPRTFGVITSFNAKETPLASSQDLGIEKASIFTIYPYFF